MGCGSSRSAVAVIDNNNTIDDVTFKNASKKSLKESNKNINQCGETTQKNISQSTTELFQAKFNSSLSSKNYDIVKGKNENNKKDKVPSQTSSNNTSLKVSDDKFNRTPSNNSLASVRSDKKPSTAGSTKSSDSGVFEDPERQSSAKSINSTQVQPKPSSGKKSSARQRLLRIEDNILINTSNQNNENIETFNVVERPKTRSGNVAFDLFLDAPETGNMKKKPEKLPAIKKRKPTKKIKTREDIERKMREVEERRKTQEMEKQIKAKQFQHLAVYTTVQTFTPVEDDEEANLIEEKALIQT